MLRLSDKWRPALASQPETGMGYWIASTYLTDGRRFDRCVIDSGYVTTVGDSTEIPFTDAEIARIVVNHGR